MPIYTPYVIFALALLALVQLDSLIQFMSKKTTDACVILHARQNNLVCERECVSEIELIVSEIDCVQNSKICRPI